MSAFIEIQEVLRQRADYEARLRLLPYDGTPEIKDPPHNCAQTIHIIPATQISRKSAIQAHYLHTK